MSIKEKVAYVKGLAEGLGLDSDVKTEKLIAIMIETLDAMADEIEELNQNALDVGDELDAISEDLGEVEDLLFGDEDDDFDDFDDFDDDDEFDDECGCEFCGGGCFSYEVACPACGAEIELDEDDLALDSVNCPKCNEVLEFEFDEFDEDDFDDDDDDIEVELITEDDKK